eukprot:g3496.t1
MKTLQRALDAMPVERRKHIAPVATSAQWSPSRFVSPGIFKGGYASAIVLHEHSFQQQQPLRVGFFLQEANVSYPDHAHDAEEFYFVLSGNAKWKIDEKEEFIAKPGDIIHHRSAQMHAMRTADEPLLAAWIWRGKLAGNYWFKTNPENKFDTVISK